LNFGNVNNLDVDMWAVNIQVGLNVCSVSTHPYDDLL